MDMTLDPSGGRGWDERNKGVFGECRGEERDDDERLVGRAPITRRHTPHGRHTCRYVRQFRIIHTPDQDHQRCYQVREMDMEYRRCGEGVVAGMW
jgi:hypothetical protein